MTHPNLLAACLLEVIRINGTTEYRATFRVNDERLHVFVREPNVMLRLDVSCPIGRVPEELLDKLKTFV